jgi:CspA family cold shock protein
MATGTIKFYNESKGYGFIAPDAGGVDLFVHISSCDERIEALEKGQRVRFEERTSARSGNPKRTPWRWSDALR